MRYRLITIGREFGCGSGELGQRLAQGLGWKLFDRELIDEIARTAELDPNACRQADERLDSWLHRIGKGLWNAAGEKGPALVPDQNLDAEGMAALTRKVIEDLAAAGQCVIVGRGGNYLLRERRDAFHVFLYAPRAWRIRRLQAQGLERGAAAALVDRRDHDRAAYIRRHFNDAWPQPQLYHLMLNATLGPELLGAAVLAALGEQGTGDRGQWSGNCD
ncbi:MAG TPA: cytidylate kinase-like family protein [Terriglobales bacterium]|nr:cytidylate kinase-like family protein [Terriglobales bacterium]